VSSPCKPGEQPARRHDLVFVSGPGWRAMLGSRSDLAADPLVTRWSDQGWPTIRRRALPADPPGIALGLPLPPLNGKKRLSFVLQSADIISVRRPPSLASARRAAPSTWRATLDRLDELAHRHCVGVRIFGSLAWQALTGLAYVTERSDLDLLLSINNDTDLNHLTADVAAVEATAPMRLDGELMRADGAAVNWREIHGGAGEVLVKSIEGVALVDRSRFISGGTS
jgi:phosphoribosyl-dephospho-CoA transferase